MPTKQGNVSVVSGIDADDNVVALFTDENDRLVVNLDIRHQLSIDGATHKYGVGVIENAGSNIYTIPADTVFYLTDVYLSITNGDAAVQFGWLYVYDDGAALKAGWRIAAGPSQGNQVHVKPVIPIKMLAGWYLNLKSNAENCPVQANYSGLIE